MESKSVESSEQSVFRTGAQDDSLGLNYVKWSTRYKCFQAYVCYAMNFQTVVNFSLVIGTYGFVALIPYFIFRIFVGIPTVLMKILLERYILGNISKAWNMTPLAKAILYCSLGKTIYTSVGNGVALAYLLKYLTSCLHYKLPWEICDSSWAKENCYVGYTNTTALLMCKRLYSADYCNNLEWEPSAHQYWQYVIADHTNFRNTSYSILCTTTMLMFCLLAVYKGVRSLEKCLTLFMYVPIVLAATLASITFLIPGIFCGSAKMWYVEYSHLLNFELWGSVYDQTLVSLGMGIMTVSFVSVHGRFTDDFFIDVLVVSFSDLFCAMLFAAPILSVVAAQFPCETPRPKIYFSSKVGVLIELSEAVAIFPTPKTMWATLFYLELLLMACSTQSLLILSACETIQGLFHSNRITHFIVLSVFFGFLLVACSICLSLGMTLNFMFAGFTNMILFLMAVTLLFCYGYNRLLDDFNFVMGYVVPLFLRMCWLILPAVSLIMMSGRLYLMKMDPNTSIFVWLYTLIPLTIYALNAIIQMILALKKKKFLSAFLPNPDWGPQNHVLRVSRIVFNSHTVTRESLYRQELDKKPQMKMYDFKEQNIVQPY